MHWSHNTDRYFSKQNLLIYYKSHFQSKDFQNGQSNSNILVRARHIARYHIMFSNRNGIDILTDLPLLTVTSTIATYIFKIKAIIY